MSDLFIVCMIMRPGFEGICKEGDFVIGLLCDVVIRYLGDKVIV